MNALFISNDPSIFNTASPTFARMKRYADAIGEVHILMRSKTSQEHHDGTLHVYGEVAGKLEAGKLIRRAQQLIAEHAIQVVSAQDPFEHGWIAMKAVKGTAAKLHIQVHTDFLSPWFVRGGIFRSPQLSVPAKNHVRRIVADRVLPHADGIRVVSERVKQSLIARYGTKIPEPVVIPIAVDATLPDPVPLPPHAFPFALLTVGRLEPEKRIPDLIEALARVRAKYPAIGLIIVGEGREKANLEVLVNERGLQDRVVFAPWTDQVWGMMRSAQGYIQASAYEGYGRTLVEAALARVPIITTDVGIVGEVLLGYEDVLATPPGDPTNLAYHMIALLEDVGSKELRIRNAETKARAHIEKYLDLPKLVASDLERLTSGSTPA